MPSQKMRYAAGVDLGGTKIELGIVDELGKVYECSRLETLATEGPKAIEEQILKGIEILKKKTHVALSGIGVGVAGQIEADTGVVIFAPNLNGWNHYPLKDNLEKALKIPAYIVNDVRAITLGEWLYGAGKGSENILCVFIGTGIGGGLVSGGRLLKGCSNTFGEVGHLTIDYNGPICTCGKRGCLEALAGGWGIAARAQEAVEIASYKKEAIDILNMVGNNVKAITAKVVIDAYRRKNPIAEKIIRQAQRALIAGLASLVNIYNPCRLILGGGLLDGMPELLTLGDQGVKETALHAATKSLQVVKACIGKEIGVIGSAAAIFNLLQEPAHG